MARISAKDTRTIHAACGDKQHGDSQSTWANALKDWGNDYLRGCGYKIP
jgi:hypothetical protein